MLMRKTTKVTAYMLAAALTFSGMGLTAQAASASDSVLPSGGVSLALGKGTKLDDISNNPSLPIEALVEWMNLEELAEEETAAPTEEDIFRNLVIAQVDRKSVV